MKKLISNYKGFTLVELMVVVGIIGILATIAIPNFRKYQAKSKTTESKIQLSSLYTAMESALLEYDTYTSCLNLMGFDPSPDRASRHYMIGVAASGTTATDPNPTAVTNGLVACSSVGLDCTTGPNATGCKSYDAQKKASGTTITDSNFTVATYLTGTSLANATFTAAAAGRISAGGLVDVWRMDQGKKLLHATVGY